MPRSTMFQRQLYRELLDVLIRVGLIAILVGFCFRTFLPFLRLMMWALILAVTFYPLQARLRRHFGERNGLIATLIVLTAFAVVLAPTCYRPSLWRNRSSTCLRS